MNIEWLKNKTKEKFYPITHAKAVLFGENNTTVNDEIDKITSKLSKQLGSHTVKSDVPENAVFTDTVYDDTEVQKRISDNGYGELAGGKNLATVSSFSTPNNEIIFTKKDDSTLIANGSNYNAGVGLTKIFLAKAGITYTAQIITDLQLNMFIWNSDESSSVTSITENKKISFYVTKDTNISISIDANNVVFNNTEIKVQLEEGPVATEYEPYFPSNKMLAEEKADKSETTVNLLKPTLGTVTQNGVTCTNNGDGTYTFTGTNSSDTPVNFLVGNVTITNKDRYKIVGCPTNKSTEDHAHIYLHNKDHSIVMNDFGNGDDGNNTILPNGVYDIQIEVRGNETVNNIFKPMITTNLDATYDDFVSYTGSTGQINSDVASLLKRIETLESLVNKTDTTTVESE